MHSSILAGKIPWTEELTGYSPWGLKESDMTDWLSMHAYDISNYQIKISAISEIRSVNNLHNHMSIDSINSSGTNCKNQSNALHSISTMRDVLFKDILWGTTQEFFDTSHPDLSKNWLQMGKDEKT